MGTFLIVIGSYSYTSSLDEVVANCEGSGTGGVEASACGFSTGALALVDSLDCVGRVGASSLISFGSVNQENEVHDELLVDGGLCNRLPNSVPYGSLAIARSTASRKESKSL